MMHWKRISNAHYKLMVDTRTVANLKQLTEGKWTVETNGDESHFFAEYYIQAQRQALIIYMGILGKLTSMASHLHGKI